MLCQFLYFFSQQSCSTYVWRFSVRYQICSEWSEIEVYATSLPKFPSLNVSSCPQILSISNHSVVDEKCVQVGPASFKLSQQSNVHFITYYSCKYFHTVSSLRLHFFLFHFISPPRVWINTIIKVILFYSTALPMLWKVPNPVDWISARNLRSCVCSRSSSSYVFETFLPFVLRVSDLTQPSLSSLCVCRSIWTCAPQQSSIPPASPTLGAPAPPATTPCFPTTHYRTSPASPSTSTSTGMSKHEPSSTLVHLVWPTLILPVGVLKHAPNFLHPPSPSPPVAPGGLMGPDRTGWWQRCCHTLILPYAHTLYINIGHAHMRS